MFSIVLTSTRIGSPILGVIIPVIILGLSIVLTLMLIRRFIKR